MRSQLTPQSAAQRQARISCEHGQLVGACTQTYSSSVESLPNSTREIGSQGSVCSNYQTCLLRLQTPDINLLLCRASQAASRLMPWLGPGERARLRCSTASGRTCRPWARATASSLPAPAGLRPSRPPPTRHARSRCGRFRYRPRQPRPCRAAYRPAAAQPRTARRRRHCRLHASEWRWVGADISSCRGAACARRFVAQSAEINYLGPLTSPTQASAVRSTCTPRCRALDTAPCCPPAQTGEGPSQATPGHGAHSPAMAPPRGWPDAGRVAVLQGLRRVALCATAACRCGSAIRQPAASASTKSSASQAAHSCRFTPVVLCRQGRYTAPSFITHHPLWTSAPEADANHIFRACGHIG